MPPGQLICPDSSSVPAGLTQACLSVWTQDSSSRTATVRRQTSGPCAVHLVADVIEVWAAETHPVKGIPRASSEHLPASLTAAVNVEADGGFGEAVHEVSSRTGLDVHGGVPLAAVVVEAGTHGQGDDAVLELGVAAAEPDGGVCSTVVLRDAESGHGVASQAGEAVPLPRHVAVTQGDAGRLVHVELRVPPGFIQADVGRARIQG